MENLYPYLEAAGLLSLILIIISCIEYFANKGRFFSVKERAKNIGYLFILFVIGDALLSFFHGIYEYVPFPYRIENKFIYLAFYLFTFDSIYYLYHRLQHKWNWLWKAHRLHHSGEHTNSTTSFRTNIIDGMIQYFIVQIPCLLIVGFHSEAYYYSYYTTIGLLIFSHMDIRLGSGIISKVIITPNVHHIHHRNEATQSNYSQYFPIIDILGRTYKSRPD